jgi:hypothetical protein
MRATLRFLRNLAILSLAGIALALAGYDLIAFQPHVHEIDALLESADPEDSAPGTAAHEFLLLEGAGPSTRVARHLLKRFVPEPRGGLLGWHGRFLLWDLMVRLHLGRKEILGLDAALAGGVGTGLNDLAERLYGKSLSELSRAEAATVVAYARAPGHYARRPDLLLERRDDLLRRIP